MTRWRFPVRSEASPVIATPLLSVLRRRSKGLKISPNSTSATRLYYSFTSETSLENDILGVHLHTMQKWLTHSQDPLRIISQVYARTQVQRSPRVIFRSSVIGLLIHPRIPRVSLPHQRWHPGVTVNPNNFCIIHRKQISKLRSVEYRGVFGE